MKFTKIHDTTLQPIEYGRVNDHWKGNVKSFFNKYRKPIYPFKKNFDYTNQEQILKNFGLIGFEYGNWVTQEERYNFLISSHVALYDLALLMGRKNIGYNKLFIAFGARGKSPALAHFEPETNAINLTRENGWSSLAHEYGHFLDYYFGGYIEQDKATRALSNGRITAKYIDLSRYNVSSLRYKMNDLINTINFIIINGVRIPSEFSEKINKKGEYWNRRNEIFARYFERYVQYKLSKKGIQDHFLTKNKYSEDVYVSNVDFKRALPKMDLLMNTIKKMGNPQTKLNL